VPWPLNRVLAAAAVAGLAAGSLTFVDAASARPRRTLRDTGILEQVSTFTTYFTGGEPRSRNIIRVAKEVDGAVVKPGETFSLNGYTGPRGYAEGYVDAPVILGGRLINAVGGGISQFTTTLFNAVYYAGLEDVFHKPHSYYISRYPAVIESTIYYPTLDLKFRNDTTHGILVDTATTADSVTVTLWGTKEYDVSTKWGPKRHVTHPRTVRVSGPGCIPTSGTDGFAQDAWRIFKRAGAEVKREKFSWRYRAEPRFVCASR
jgi:vancomycin resistance protein YoaR